ncbi:MEDS domain-containing protein [Steroidobacter agaridevorans]|nr:MEDS domain-containing protein [Steroidobacter agaridevorans]
MQLSSVPSRKDSMGISGPSYPAPMSNSAHIVHFFRSDEEYVRAAGYFLREGLEAHETCVAVATAEHHRQLDRYLRESGLDPDLLSAEYRYVPLQAEQMLPTFFDAQAGIDQDRFHRQFNQLVIQAASRGQPVRLFGEMVSLLAEQGRPALAIQLEELWNELSRQHSFSLFCAYKVSPFTENPRYRKLLHSIHSHVVCEGA